jgi:hypothetical protein
MKSTRHSKDNMAPKRTERPGGRKSIRREWPFLLYPALVIAAVVVLYAANGPHSEHPSGTGGRKPGSNPPLAGGITPDGPALAVSDINTKTGTGRRVSSGVNGKQPATDDTRKTGSRRTTKADGNVPASGASLPPINEPPIMASLRHAVQTKDQVALKNCLDQLVAQGDQAIAPLCDVITRGGDTTAVWAAEALARIGTPAATQALLDALAKLGDSVYKEQIARKAACVANHDSWPALMEAVQTSQDSIVQRAAGAALAQMADAPIVDELVARYDSAATVDEAATWANTISRISATKATESLLTLARRAPSFSQDPLDQAVLRAVANVGDAQCVDYLLSRIEASQPGETAYLMNLVNQIHQPQAQAALLYAAAGNKGLSADQGRTAAIQALANYPDEQTYVVLEQIASAERNAVVATAASRSLETIQRAAPLLAANARFKPGEHILVAKPTQK